MMCYRDRMFCEGQGCAKFNGCAIALTDEVYAKAETWWKDLKKSDPNRSEPPIQIEPEPKKLPCYEKPKS